MNYLKIKLILILLCDAKYILLRSWCPTESTILLAMPSGLPLIVIIYIYSWKELKLNLFNISLSEDLASEVGGHLNDYVNQVNTNTFM